MIIYFLFSLFSCGCFQNFRERFGVEFGEFGEHLSVDNLTRAVHMLEEEFNIEINWLKSVGKAKQRGSFMSIDENFTIQ